MTNNFPIYLALILAATLLMSCTRTPQAQQTPAPSPTPVQQKPLETAGVIIGKPYPGRGVVTIINRKEGWIEIDHEDMVGLMPAMQMEFWVKDRSLLRNVKVGDKVDFVIVETGKGEFLTEIKRIK